MFDFVSINTKVNNKDKTITVYPSFIVDDSEDLMIKGKTFYAIWDKEKGMWSKNERRACKLIDKETAEVYNELKEQKPDYTVMMTRLQNYDSRRYTTWLNYCKSLPDNYKQLDQDITFLSDEVRKEDYRSQRLGYDLADIPTPNYDELMNTLYSDEERQKIEWAIGSIIAGDSKKIQKFYVLYGAPGTGKSTVLIIIDKLFKGYTSTFNSMSLGNANSAFALEPFKDNPLIAIDDDGDLYRIDNNTRLNTIASHESLIVNEKNKAQYAAKFNSVMLIGTNKPVRITDAKSGVIRRLIDIVPTGHLIEQRRYDAIMEQIDFELAGIAYHCFEVYKKLGKRYYSNYKPINMMGITNDFYNFVEDNLDFFIEHKDQVQLKRVWQMYKEYCEDANVQYPFMKKAFKEELKNYFDEFQERTHDARNVYKGFQFDKFEYVFKADEEPKDDTPYALTFDETESIFDKLYHDAPAQYAGDNGKPQKKWIEVTTKLKDLDTHKLHYVLMGGYSVICVDFDLKNDKGEKDFQLNLEAASKWPATYAELSKSGGGIHLYYIYEGDVTKLNPIYDKDIEVKVFTGGSSLRRMVTKCNNLSLAKISSGLPVKGDKMVNLEAMKNEKQLRALIRNCLLKKHHGSTKPEVDYIYSTLEKCYASGMKYDVTDMRTDITAFANNSTHQALACLKLVSKMKFKSEEPSESKDDKEAPIIFYDVEVFPNLFIICWKFQGKDEPVIRMINPSPEDVEYLFKYRLVGFNNRRYDNHIIYARSLGYSETELFQLSQKIITGTKKEENRNCFFMEAYNLSYTDIYDYSTDKKSLKKWEIELGIHHLENEYAWDQDVDESHWEEIADYCCNDVIATEAVFNATQADFKARLILAELSGLSVNDTTNSQTTRLIVGTDRHPQDKFIYTDLSKEFPGYRFDEHGIPKEEYLDPEQIVNGKSIYMGEDPSEGGYVYAEPGIHYNVALLDVASLHPTSAIILCIFGKEYTTNYAQLKQIRIYIKHRQYDKVRAMFDGKLARYLTSDADADALSFALKIAINSVYGLTSAKFDNKLRDPRNKDNIVAKRGALFMITLKHEVQKRGFTVAHIKTDSIKIPNATPEIISFVTEFGKKYGYDFEHEATYEKMCLVNDAVYIAKVKEGKHAGEWTATGTEFQVPYVFKTLFSHEPITFKDYCEVKSVQKGTLYLDMNETLPDVSAYEKELSKLTHHELIDGTVAKSVVFATEEMNRINELETEIAKGHNYKFVGRVGEFVPIMPGNGAGILYRVQDGKNYAVAGTKGYRWLDAETVKESGYEDKIDISYFDKEVNDAIAHINQFGDFDKFVSDEPFDIYNHITNDNRVEVPFDEDFKAMNPPVIV